MKEYGGYLPLELNNTGEYYNYTDENLLKTNSGLTAIYCALKMLNPRRVFVPYFICHSVDDLLNSMNYTIIYYNINQNFEPVGIDCNDDDCIILVNYFGINSVMISANCLKYKKVIIDNTQAFFAKPILNKYIYNVYSCRKFIGVSDGGYLIGEKIYPIDLEQDKSSKRAVFLLDQYESGINGAYEQSKLSYETIKNERKRMSALTEKILNAVNYEKIKEARIKNYMKLDSILKDFNIIDVTLYPEEIPYSYPFMIKKDIRNKLITAGIYIPWIWREKLQMVFPFEIERNFINYIFHLPIDQRYNEADMTYIAGIVLNLMEEKQ